ncbi:MAG TPA: hypothetical protein VFH51_02415, partial [Myxococcota bacterium]|nr:hypothetical protein [Myxococcota bacterium]
MVKPSIHGARPSVTAAPHPKRRRDTRNKKATASEAPKVLERVEAGAAPHVTTPQLANLRRALRDQDAASPYSAVLVKSATESAAEVLKAVVADAVGDPTYAFRIDKDLKGEAAAEKLAEVQSDLERLGKKVAALTLFWDHESPGAAPSGGLQLLLGGALSGSEDEDDEDDESEAEGGPSWPEQVSRAVAALHKAAPDVKVVILTQAKALGSSSALGECEVFDADALGWDADKDGFEHRAEALGRRFNVSVPTAALSEALRPVGYGQLQSVLQYAQVLGKRKAHEAGLAEPPQAGLSEVQEAVASFKLRNHGASSKDVEKLLVPTRGADFVHSSVEVPAGLRDFCAVLADFPAYQAVNADATKSLIIWGEDNDAKLTLAKALAGELDAPLCMPPQSEVPELLVEKGGRGIRKILDSLNEYAETRHTTALLYLGDVDALLSLGEKTESTLGTNLVASMLADLLREAGKAKGWPHVAIIAAVADENEAGIDGIKAVAHEARLGKLSPAALAKAMRHLLDTAHPAHDVNDAELKHIAANIIPGGIGFNLEHVT